MQYRIFAPAFILALAPTLIHAGSLTYSTPGTYSFTVPYYSSMTVNVWGAGGGGGACGIGTSGASAGGGVPGSTGEASYFGGVYGGSGSGGSGGSYLSGGSGGAGGSASGGSTNSSGNYGSTAGGSTGGSGGTAPSGGGGGAGGGNKASGSAGGAPGGGGGGSGGCSDSGAFYGGGGGGSGGFSSYTYTTGQLTPGSTVSVTVGSGGAAGSQYYSGGAGAAGQVSISWSDAAPTCSVSVSPSTINQPNSSTLSWSSSNATWFYIDNVGYVTPNQSSNTSVAPSQTTTYSATVSGPGGTGSCGATLTVNRQCTLPWGGTIQHGQSTTAYQTSSVPYGQSCVSQTRTCTDGTLSSSYQYQSCTVDSVPPPSCSTFSANPTAITQGNSSTISWTCSNATSCNGSGTGFSTGGAISGTDGVSPTVTTNYSLSCIGAGGTTNISPITVTVSCAPIYSCSGDTIQYTNSSCQTSNITTCVSPYYCSAGSSSCLYAPPSGGLGGGTAIRATPRFVRSGNTATVNWDVDNASACTVSGNGNSWNGTSGTQTTNPIVQQVTYTIVCDDLDEDTIKDDFTASATVYVIPKWFEF